MMMGNFMHSVILYVLHSMTILQKYLWYRNPKYVSFPWKPTEKMASIKVILILPFYLFAIFQLIGCVEHVKKRKDSQRQGKSKCFISTLQITQIRTTPTTWRNIFNVSLPIENHPFLSSWWMVIACWII